MVILKYGRASERNLAVFGRSLQRCGVQLFDRLLSWSGDEHWPVSKENCQMFRIEKVGLGMETRVEILGPEKLSALRLVREGITTG
jgi:hypothetical protein